MAPVATTHRTRPSQCRRGAQHADPNPNPGPGPNPNPSPGPDPHPHPPQANNKYDAEYIRYFAGVDALYIPSYCGYAAKAQYSPVKGKSLLPNLITLTLTLTLTLTPTLTLTLTLYPNPNPVP